jgi:hypothetical protein
LLLLPACSDFWSPDDDPVIYEYALTWTCASAEGCERAADVSRIDRLTVDNYYDFLFTSTHDPSFAQDALRVNSDATGSGCFWLYFLSLFEHELERSRVCATPGGIEFELSIPNPDPATHSQWLVAARDLRLL